MSPERRLNLGVHGKWKLEYKDDLSLCAVRGCSKHRIEVSTNVYGKWRVCIDHARGYYGLIWECIFHPFMRHSPIANDQQCDSCKKEEARIRLAMERLHRIKAKRWARKPELW
jgi:hypothetical protein